MSNLIKDSISDDIVSLCESIVMKEGVKDINVRRIIKEMGVTNRVFYNRFHNIEEVLEIIYYKNMASMQRSIRSDKDIAKDFFGYATDVAVNVLLNTYDIKQKFCQYMFEFDSYTSMNCAWWTDKIMQMVETAKQTGQLKEEINSQRLSYTIWCFLHGFNADAVNRNIPKEDAVENLIFGLNCIFYGVKK